MSSSRLVAGGVLWWPKAMNEVTRIFSAIEQGDPIAGSELLPLFYDDLLALDAGLAKLAERHPLKARLVELRFFGGLTCGQAAEILGISPSTADRDWIFARAWLRREVKAGKALEEN
jgi:DNA-directed RNA polymerase specialized sigma24 family protein